MGQKRAKTSASRAAPPAAESVGGVLSGRVRELRNKKGWTLEEMSSACSVSRSMLSEIERGRANPTLAVAFRIAQAFGLSLDDLVELPTVTHRLDVIRSDDQSYYFRSDRYCRIRTLSPLHLEKAVEFYEIVLHGGAALKSEPHFEGAKELLTVQQGAVRVRSGEESVDLSIGDSAHYPADVLHAIENLGRDDAVLFLVVTYLRD
jgi:transcriptional regulator with XRE-family HTH domain